MKRPTIEDRATLTPAKCVISGAGDGPIIDTKADFSDGPPRGRIYVQVGAIAGLLRDLGWMDPTDTAALKADNDRLSNQVGRLTAENDRLEALRLAVEAFVPEPVVETREVVRTVDRPPSQEEIEAFLRANPNHQTVEPGSTEHWRQMYGKTGPTTAKERAEKRRRQELRAQAVEQQQADDRLAFGEPPSTWTLHGQTVDLDEVLSSTVQDVKAFVDGHPADFQRAVLAREVWTRTQAGKNPRKMIVDAIVDTVGDNDNEETKS